MFKSSIAAVFSFLLLAVGSVQAAPVSGNFNSKGYDVFTIQVAADARVAFSTTGGYADPTISLFSASGQHLITNDDSNGLSFRLTQDLAAGQYSVLISYCCSVIDAGALPDTSFADTDGFNIGTYWIDGSGTLTTARNYLDQIGLTDIDASGASYALDMRNADIAAIPEPATLALAGLGLMGVAVGRRRQK